MAVDTSSEGKSVVTGDEGPVPSGSGVAAPQRAAGGSPAQIYKQGQGTYVRWGTAVGGALIAYGGCVFLYDQLKLFVGMSETVRLLIPAVVFVAAGVGLFWLVGQSRGAVDFMVATEGEMKKVNWSSRKEVIGATQVVIVTVLVMALLLFITDVICIVVFSSMGVLAGDILKGMFGGAS
ncbi:MAG: Protein translocase subunit SecE [Phycisphaerae bacterium]|nr:Protein translocase subunit SecE [Phycisphaerae bacterium]